MFTKWLCTSQGARRGFIGFVKEENPNIQVDHCTIHRYSIGCKTLPASLKAVLDGVVVFFPKTIQLYKFVCAQ